MPGVTVQAVSHYRETPPVGGPPGQQSFLNGACLIDTDLPPRVVLEILAAVEKTLHRERAERWGPRTIDLDLLLYDDIVIDTPDLTIPHPRMATRRFVLEPAAEIAGDLTFPLAACSIRDLLANISAPHPLVVVVGVPGSGASEVASVGSVDTSAHSRAGGDIQATTKVVDCRSLKSSPPCFLELRDPGLIGPGFDVGRARR